MPMRPDRRASILDACGWCVNERTAEHGGRTSAHSNTSPVKAMGGMEEYDMGRITKQNASAIATLI